MPCLSGCAQRRAKYLGWVDALCAGGLVSGLVGGCAVVWMAGWVLVRTGPYGSVLVRTGPYAPVRIRTGPYGSVLVSTGPYGCVRVRTGPYASVRTSRLLSWWVGGWVGVRTQHVM